MSVGFAPRSPPRMDVCPQTPGCCLLISEFFKTLLCVTINSLRVQFTVGVLLRDNILGQVAHTLVPVVKQLIPYRSNNNGNVTADCGKAGDQITVRNTRHRLTAGSREEEAMGAGL